MTALTRRSLVLRIAAAALAAPLVAACSDADRVLEEREQPRAAPGGVRPARLALVLSGGGLRGFAHLGVLRGLRVLGIEPDLVVGSSVGAVIGGLFASGCALDVFERALDLDPDLDPWGSLLLSAATRNRKLEALLVARLGCVRLQDFPRRFVAVATARDSGAPVLLSVGDAARAIVASAALPGALAPVAAGGIELVDGGLSLPLPVRAARALGAERVIAVDVSWHPEVPPPNGALGSLFHAGFLMARNLTAIDRALADVLIEPALPPVPEVTLAQRARLVECGERAVQGAAAALVALALARTTTGAHTDHGLVASPCCSADAQLARSPGPQRKVAESRFLESTPRGHC